MNALMRYDPSPIDLADYIPAKDAATALGIHIDSMTRQCRNELKFKGMAIESRPAEGGQLQWFILRSSDPKFAAPTPDSRYVYPDLMEFSEKRRENTFAKLKCVLALRTLRTSSFKGTMNAAVDMLIDTLRKELPALRIGRSQLYEWDKRLRHPADLIQLVDSRGGDVAGQDSEAAWDALKSLYCHANRPSLRQCYKTVKVMAAENNWRWGSYGSCARKLREKIPLATALAAREPATFGQQLSAFIPQDPEGLAAGECWIGDHHQLNILCRFGGLIIRPWLSVWMDWRTRKICGWVLSDNPNSTTILGALRHGLMDQSNNGGPSMVWTDNGKDFDAWLFHGQTKRERRARIKPSIDEQSARGIFGRLGIEPHFAIPYNANGKARCERFFGSLEAFYRTFDTYVGNSPESKPERLAEVLREPRLVPSFEEVHQRIGDHIAGSNARTDHAIDDLVENGERLSPAGAMARWCETPRMMADPKALDLLLMHWHRPLPVGRNGITLRVFGEPIHYGYCNPALIRFQALRKEDRKLVMVAYDPHDIRTLRVFDERWAFVCIAEMNLVGGVHHTNGPIPASNVKELSRQKARIKNAMKVKNREYLITHTHTNEERIAHMAALQPAAPEARPPATVRIIQTPLDGQAKFVEAAETRRALTASPVQRREDANAFAKLGEYLRRGDEERRRKEEEAEDGVEGLRPTRFAYSSPSFDPREDQ